jgi:mono/diheme cytochrome c family protein
MKQISTAAVLGLKVGAGIISTALMFGCSAPAVNPTGAGSAGSAGTGVPASTGEAFFEMTVFPALAAASCNSCHASGTGGAPVYLTADAAGSYAKIKMSPTVYKPAAQSSMFTIGTATSPHVGGPIPANIKTAATQWLNLEFPAMTGTTAASGGGTGIDTGTTGTTNAYNELVDAFAQCMNRGDWNQLMSQFPLIPTDDFGTCSSCHGEGNGGTFLNADPNITYNSIRSIPYVYRLVQPRFENGVLTGIDASSRLIDKGLLPFPVICFDVNKVICHSTYTIPNDQQSDLQAFQAKTLNKIKNGKCSLPEPP